MQPRKTKTQNKPAFSWLLTLAGGSVIFISGCLLGVELLGNQNEVLGESTLLQLRRATTTTNNISGTTLPLSSDSSSSTPLASYKLGLSAQRDRKEPPRSLHPKWKLWSEMNEEGQKGALDRVAVYIRKYGNLITDNQKRKKGMIVHGRCPAVLIGTGHKLCGPPPPKDSGCVFFSFGINDDPSFDQQLAELWDCRGFAGDPTVQHPSKLHDKVTFHNMGATILSDNEERQINKGGTEEWWTTSMPKLKDFLGLDHVNVIKLDCEGCEVALARDILAEDPTFLLHVDQLSIETHVTKTWITTLEQVYYFGLQFPLLEEAGFQLEWSNIFGCSKRHEDSGCMPEFAEMEFPCGFDPWPGHPKVVLGRSCHDFLWKRYPLLDNNNNRTTIA
ncbi:hypothetical protein ACA910_010045 [Epithemia clementina (nom. ined.)]